MSMMINHKQIEGQILKAYIYTFFNEEEVRLHTLESISKAKTPNMINQVVDKEKGQSTPHMLTHDNFMSQNF
jgi:hypothetical protein